MGPNYYNEFDKYAAEWLVELIAAGLIAPGVVDTRSIEDVHPADLKDFTQCHFFAGIGVWSLALRRAGWPDDRPVWTGSCPCQPFSAAGQGAGFADERHLWPAFFHLISEHKRWCEQQKRPIPIVLGEQVASKDVEPWIDLVQDDLEGLGYRVGAVPFPSAGVGAPHIRDRLYWVADAASQRRGRREGAAGRSIAYREDAGRVEGNHGIAYLSQAGLRMANADSSTGGKGRANVRGWADRGDAQSRSRPGGGHMLDRLAHTTCAGPSIERGNGRQPERRAEGCGAGGLGHSGHDHDAGEVAAAGAGQSQAHRPADIAGGSGIPSGGLADANGGHASAERQQCGGEQRQQQEDGGRGGLARRGEQPGAVIDGDTGAGPTNGYWRAADWLGCRDGKWRPVEPGTFPLAHGATARVGRLRAYGNAINAEAARVFIEAVMECQP